MAERAVLSSCDRCGGICARDGWCPSCVPGEYVARPAYDIDFPPLAFLPHEMATTSRTKRSAVSYGLRGRIAWTLGAAVFFPLFCLWYFTAFAGLVLFPYVIFILPWMLHDIWRSVRIPPGAES